MRQSSQTVSPMSNEGRNLYVVKHITETLLRLMEENHISDISISQICDEAGVGRASFYRNFESKEDIISKYLKKILDDWWVAVITSPDFNLVEAVFSHFSENSRLYLMLHSQGLSHLNLQNIKAACGPKPDQENMVAYTTAYFSYGLYGWIEEWFSRGMPETPEEMAALWMQAQSQGQAHISSSEPK